MSVKVFQRKFLHMGKQIRPDFLHDRLGSADHQLIVAETCQRSDGVHHSHKKDHPDQPRHILLQYIGVDHRFQQIGSINIGESAHCHKNGDRSHDLLVPAQVTEHLKQGLFCIFRPFITGCPCHYRFAPSC